VGRFVRNPTHGIPKCSLGFNVWGWVLLSLWEEDKDTRSSFHDVINAHQKLSISGMMARACLRTAISSYNIWFWFKGLQSLPILGSCAPKIFLLRLFV
jgi:hypothetical protein